MDRESRRRLEEYRRQEAGEIENTLLDEFAAGEMDREEFIRRGTMFGLSLPLIGGILAALGEAPLAFAKPEAVKGGGRIRVGVFPAPTATLEPHTYQETGGLVTGGIAGEFLTRATQSLTLLPELATSWTPSQGAKVWTFKLRQGVKFQTGQTMTADDVVTTFKRLVDPNAGSQALSAFQGVLSPGGVRKIDDSTVQFVLDSPTASFPYLTSSTTYQAIILPANYQVGTFEKTPQTTGAFRLVSYTPGVGAKYDRNTGWWGGQAPLDGVDVTYYTDDAAAISGLLGGQIDLLNQVVFATGRPLFNNANIQILPVRGATHRQVPMRVDRKPFTDFRVRQAVALTLDRPAIIRTLFNNLADIGNDSPFAPVFPSTDRSVAQRKKDLRTARQLLEAAGYGNGLSIELTTEKVEEIPRLAQIIQQSVRAIGVNMRLKILTVSQYFAGTPKTTPWLNASMTITDWGHRAVPNVYLTSALQSNGVWNAAHYKSKQFDRLGKSFLGAVALSDQKRYAGQIQRLLLRETPVIFPYFYNYIGAGSKRVRGYKSDALGQVYLSKTSLA